VHQEGLQYRQIDGVAVLPHVVEDRVLQGLLLTLLLQVIAHGPALGRLRLFWFGYVSAHALVEVLMVS